MNDVKDLLERALNDGPGAGRPIPTEMDPNGDRLRGRALLRRRRITAVTGAALVAVSLAAVPLALGGGGNSTSTTSASAEATTDLPHIELASYSGKQVPGYEVAWTPKGWVIQGGTSTYLTIAPVGAKSQDPSSYEGKLVLSQVARGAEPTTAARQKGLTYQPVNNQPGWLYQAPTTMSAAEANARKAGKGNANTPYIAYLTLTYKSEQGQWMYIQVPRSVGWKGSELAKFASGVKILKNAQKPS